MSGSYTEVISETELLGYRTRVLKARECFLLLGRGSRQKAASELYLNPTRLSNILTCKYVDFPALLKIEIWLRGQEYPEGILVELPQEPLKRYALLEAR